MRRLWVTLAALALLTGFPTSVLAGTAPPTGAEGATAPLISIAPTSCWFFTKTTPGAYTCRVPDGVTSLTFEVRAGNGGRGAGLSSTPTPGGQGATITGSLTVTAGETLSITVGSTASGGWDGPTYKNNGGGGGYTSVAHMVGGVLTPLVVAGGGGGAGSADQTYGTTSGAGGAGGNGGTTDTTRGGGAGGDGGAAGTSASAGQDGGTMSVGGAGGSLYGGAGGDVGVTGTWQTTASWTLSNNRPGAGGGGFGAYGGYANPTYWVPAGSPRGPGYGAGGEGSTDGGGGGGGGYAGGGGGGANTTLYYATGGGGGGSSLVPDGATASIIAGGQPHVWLRPSGTATLYVEPNAQTITAGDPVPAAAFYTFSITDGTAPVMAAGLQSYTAPTCGSAYSTATPAGSMDITCGGGTNSGSAGSATGVTFDYTHTAVMTIAGAPDTTSPTLTLEQKTGQADPTTASPVNFSLGADEALDTTTVTAADFSVTNGTIGTIACTGYLVTTCTIPVTPTGDGAVTIAPASSPDFSISDVAGNAQTTAGGTDRSITYDHTAPTLTLEQKSGQADPTNASTINFTLVADEALDTTTVTAADFAVTNSNIEGETFDCSGTPTTCTIPVVPIGDGIVTIATSKAFSVADLAGNAQTTAGGSDQSVTYDATGPVITASTKIQGSKVTVYFTVVDATGSTTCALGSATASSCTSPWTATLVKGDYTVHIQASDTLGNVTTRDVTFTIKSGKVK